MLTVKENNKLETRLRILHLGKNGWLWKHLAPVMLSDPPMVVGLRMPVSMLPRHRNKRPGASVRMT